MSQTKTASATPQTPFCIGTSWSGPRKPRAAGRPRPRLLWRLFVQPGDMPNRQQFPALYKNAGVGSPRDHVS